MKNRESRNMNACMPYGVSPRAGTRYTFIMLEIDEILRLKILLSCVK